MKIILRELDFWPWFSFVENWFWQLSSETKAFVCVNVCLNRLRGGLGRLAAWHLPGGPVEPPAGRPPCQMLK